MLSVLIEISLMTSDTDLDRNKVITQCRDTWSVIPMLLRPKSRGRISLRSANPYDKPVFEAGYFSDEHDEDIKTLVEGVKIALAMAQTRAFQRLGTKFWDQIPMPGCEETDLWSDEYWACMSRHYTTTIYHHSGSQSF